VRNHLLGRRSAPGGGVFGGMGISDQGDVVSAGEGPVDRAPHALVGLCAGDHEVPDPSSGWASLTPTERDVVRLVSEGLANNEIAARLFVSPRTVQTHLTHVYSKLGLTSRVQLAQEAARHG